MQESNEQYLLGKHRVSSSLSLTSNLQPQSNFSSLAAITLYIFVLSLFAKEALTDNFCMDTLGHGAHEAQELFRNMDVTPYRVIHFMCLELMGTENRLHIKIDINNQIVLVAG